MSFARGDGRGRGGGDAAGCIFTEIRLHATRPSRVPIGLPFAHTSSDLMVAMRTPRTRWRRPRRPSPRPARAPAPGASPPPAPCARRGRRRARSPRRRATPPPPPSRVGGWLTVLSPPRAPSSPGRRAARPGTARTDRARAGSPAPNAVCTRRSASARACPAGNPPSPPPRALPAAAAPASFVRETTRSSAATRTSAPGACSSPGSAARGTETQDRLGPGASRR
mmetsp:Transcript_14593/g.61544  ORF Transcript_14593/g.61544 Transcript_14593/m.61544 type:complete len:224 (-) Transcript_14593:490-1161(-)